MAREVGTFNFSANFETLIEGTLDARQIVDNFSDLLNFTSDNFIKNGFFVAVTGVENSSERGIYICVDKNNLNFSNSWEKIGQGESDKNFIFNQSFSSNIWNIEHNLNKKPSVTIIDTSGNTVIGDIEYLDNNNIKITFNAPFSGTATLN